MSTSDLYRSIETLPVKRWFEILKTGHLHHLFIKGTGSVNEKTRDVWFDIQQQYFDEFGVDDNFRIRLVKMKKYTELVCDHIISGDRYLLNQIKQLDHELNDNGSEISSSHYKLKDAIEKHRKYHVDFDKTTVIEWGYMVKDFEEQGRKAAADQTKRKWQQ